jgi:hypothetical protein
VWNFAQTRLSAIFLKLLRHPLDGKGAEFRILLADLPSIRECRRLAIGIVTLKAFPLLNSSALRR